MPRPQSFEESSAEEVILPDRANVSRTTFIMSGDKSIGKEPVQTVDVQGDRARNVRRDPRQ